MSMHAVIAGLSGLALVVGCGRHPAQVPVAEVGRTPDCPKPDTLSHRGGGVALGPDIYRGPRYRVDSAGRVETLPPVPAAGTDTTRPGCPSSTDTSASGSPR
jgi:hypothetical protein